MTMTFSATCSLLLLVLITRPAAHIAVHRLDNRLWAKNDLHWIGDDRVSILCLISCQLKFTRHALRIIFVLGLAPSFGQRLRAFLVGLLAVRHRDVFQSDSLLNLCPARNLILSNVASAIQNSRILDGYLTAFRRGKFERTKRRVFEDLFPRLGIVDCKSHSAVHAIVGIEKHQFTLDALKIAAPFI